MSETVADVAKTIKHPIATLIQKFAEAGYPGKSSNDVVSEEEKRSLFEYLTGRTNETFVRKKQVSQIKPKGKTANPISVEIRRKKVKFKKAAKEKKPSHDRHEKTTRTAPPKTAVHRAAKIPHKSETVAVKKGKEKSAAESKQKQAQGSAEHRPARGTAANKHRPAKGTAETKHRQTKANTANKHRQAKSAEHRPAKGTAVNKQRQAKASAENKHRQTKAAIANKHRQAKAAARTKQEKSTAKAKPAKGTAKAKQETRPTHKKANFDKNKRPANRAVNKTAKDKKPGSPKLIKKDGAAPPPPPAHKKQQQKRQQLRVADNVVTKRKAKKRFQRAVVIQPTRHEFEKPTKTVVREVEVPETLSVVKLAQRLAIKGTELVKEMMNMEIMVTINQMLDQDTAILIVEELGHKAKPVKTNFEDALLAETLPLGKQLPRPPVVTVMGHVDHGKTSLLDYIRRSQLTDQEVGGITQHIGAYLVTIDAEHRHQKSMCFLDTPGHAAFTAMRARGANITDIVVLVVAADDSVMPQTKEAVEHAHAAKVPIVVAINKIDKEGINVDKVKTDLSQLGVVSEEWGGNNVFVEVSAKTGQGIDQLLDSILLQAEIMELKASLTGPATGVVIESHLDKGRGPVVNVLIMQGCLRRGDIVLAGSEYGRARVMLDEHGQMLKEATPAIPISLLGLSGVPPAGERFMVLGDEKKARTTASFRRNKVREMKLASEDQIMENMFPNFDQKKPVSVNVLVKADAQGSAEAIRDAINQLSNDDTKVKIVACGVGAISESDIRLANASAATVFGFNVRADNKARKAAQTEKVSLHYYSVIYELIEEISNMLSSAAEPIMREHIVGVAVVKDVFRSSKLGAVAGCEVKEGTVRHNYPIRVLRDDIVIYEGQLESLRHHKDQVDEVSFGTECGIAVKNYNDVKIGDSIEVYEQVEKQPSPARK